MIVKAGLEDAAELNRLVNSAYRGESSKKGWTTEADLLGGIRIDEERLKQIIEKPGAMILKYIDGQGKIIGCVQLEKHDKKLYLGLLTVSPELQNRGIGKQFLKRAEVEAKQANCSIIYMSVITRRKELIAWYEKHGYRNTGVKKPFPKDDPRFGLQKVELEFMLFEKVI